MSFDWLNVPGINTNDINAPVEKEQYLPPPSVSFDIGFQNNEQAIEQPSTRPVNGPDTSTQQTHGSINVSPMAQQASTYPRADQQEKSDNDRIKLQNHHQNQQNHIQGQHSHANKAYRESSDELRVPLSLSRSQLTKDEVRTYLRWYNYITSRTHSKLVKLVEVFKFLANFRLTEELKERIEAIFRTCKNALNIGQFFAVLRLISKALIENVIPSRRMILEKAPIPNPRPILTTGNKEEVYEEVDDEPDAKEQKVDFDSFASLLLTGKSVQKRVRRRIPDPVNRNKRVRFSEHVTFQEPPSAEGEDNDSQRLSDEEEGDDKLDFTLPMDQLLKRMAKRKEKNTALVSSIPTEQPETEEEKEVLADMKDSLSHFKQIKKVDLASIPTQIPSIRVSDNPGEEQELQPLEPLKPTSTGSANSLFRQHYNQSSAAGYQQPLQPLKPTATGSANYLVRNNVPPQQEYSPETINGSSPVTGLQPLRPTATGSGNYLMKQQLNQQYGPTGLPSPINGPDEFTSPQHTGQIPTDQYLHAPQPQISVQQQLSPQATSQSQNFQQHQNTLAVPSNPASSYFQSLLSNSPSPVTSNVNLPGMSATSNQYQIPPNNASQSRAMYNNFPYANASPNLQQNMFNAPPTRLAQSQNYQNFSRPYTMPNSSSPRGGDILSDLHSLQQQVDALQNTYGR